MNVSLVFPLEDLEEVVRRAVREELGSHDGFLDVPGAAAFLASTPSAVRTLVKRDAIPFHKTPAGRIVFDKDELRRWVARG